MSEIDKIPDLDVLAARKELETRIHQVLVKLPGLQRHRLQSDSFWRIAECMKVTENTYDTGRLPVYYEKPFAPRPKKYDCVRALATFIIVKWWDYSLERNKSPYPVAFLDQLEEIVEKGLAAFKVTGAYEGGFRLVTCKKCNDTGIDQNERGDDGRTTGCSCDCPLGVARDKAEAKADADAADSNEDAGYGEPEPDEEISMATATGETVEGIEEQLDADDTKEETE